MKATLLTMLFVLLPDAAGLHVLGTTNLVAVDLSGMRSQVPRIPPRSVACPKLLGFCRHRVAPHCHQDHVHRLPIKEEVMNQLFHQHPLFVVGFVLLLTSWATILIPTLVAFNFRERSREEQADSVQNTVLTIFILEAVAIVIEILLMLGRVSLS